MRDKLPNKSKNEMTLIIEGREIVCDTIKFLRTMDTCADGFTATFPWVPYLDPELDRVTKPYGYQESGLYIAGDLKMVGVLYIVKHILNDSGRVKELEGFSKTADIIDSSVRYPFEENNLDLKDRCESQMDSPVTNRQFDIDVIVDDGVDVGGKFKRIESEQTDNCFKNLAELAKQRSCILSCTRDGDLLITKANTTGVPVGTIEEQVGITQEFDATFNGRDRFKYYEAIVQSSKSTKTKSKQQAEDTVVTRPRFLTFSADESLPGEAKNVAQWRKNKAAADSLQKAFPVNSWYAPNGELWDVNTLVTVKSPTMGTGEKGFTFLITRVEFTYTASGATAQLSLLPPSAYTDGEIGEPWL